VLHPICENIWHAQHAFKVAGLPMSSRMTIIRLHAPSQTLVLTDLCVLEWPTARIVLCHDSIIESNAHAQLVRAFQAFPGA
jgi:hypothetical protein